MPNATQSADHRARLSEMITREDGQFALVVSGPSGVGKSTLCESIVAESDDIAHCVTTTTRPRRAGEVDGREYHFLSDAAFEAGLREGRFIEHARVYDFQYGATLDAVEAVFSESRILVVDVDVQGAQTWRALLDDHCVTLFILPPSIDVLHDRLANRQSEDGTALKRRMEEARMEIEHASTYDYLVVNHQLDEALADVRSVVRAERLKTRRRRRTLARSAS